MFCGRYLLRTVEKPARVDWVHACETVNCLTCCREKDYCYCNDLPGCFDRSLGGGCLILQTTWLGSVRSSYSACGWGG